MHNNLPDSLTLPLARRQVCWLVRLSTGAIVTRTNRSAWRKQRERVVAVIANGIARPAPNLDPHTTACVRYLARAILGSTILPVASWDNMHATRSCQGPMQKTKRPALRLIRGGASVLRRAP